jgi:hypothetical protein
MSLGRNFVIRIALGVVVSAALAWPSLAQTNPSDPKAPAEWKEQMLLGSRLRMFAPAEAVAEGRSYGNIMGTAPSASSKTRIRIPIFGTEIVAQAQSMGALAPKDMSTGIKTTKYLSRFEGEKRELTLDLAGGWKAIAIVPEQYKYWSNSYLLAYVWIQDPDGLLYELVLASWPEADVYPKLSEIAVQMIRSLEPGVYFDEIPKGTISLNSEVALRNNEIELVIDLDGKYTVDTETGITFVVHRVSRLVEFGSDAGEMGIYLGRYPNFNPDAELKRGAKMLPDQVKILGKTPTWIAYDVDGWRKQSTLIEILSGTTALKCHLFISGTPEQVEEMVGLARTLRIRPKP